MMALNPYLRAQLFPRIIRLYNQEHTNVFPKHYADKSHPNIWLAEALQNIFPESLFIGIQRNPYATVASMLKHEGVSSWHSKWKEYPIPNYFLGITSSIANKYDELSLAEKCALRWKAHKERLEYLKIVLKDKLLILNYEDLINNTEEEINKLQNFLNLSKPFAMPEVKKESLNKWKKELSNETISEIKNVIENENIRFF